MHNQKLTRSIRAVLDTNVFISGYLSESGASYEVIQHWKQKSFQLVFSAEIVEEIVEKFLEMRFDSETIDNLVSSIYLLGAATEGLYEVSVVCDDPDDDIFIATALEGNADFIVSLNYHLRSLKHYQGIQIVSPGQFLRYLRQIE